MTEYLTISEDQEIKRWGEWQDSWEAEFEAGIIDIISPSNYMIYVGEADWRKIPLQPASDREKQNYESMHPHAA